VEEGGGYVFFFRFFFFLGIRGGTKTGGVGAAAQSTSPRVFSGETGWRKPNVGEAARKPRAISAARAGVGKVR